jgi:3-oxoacyl-[acyl-carrier protein] reductase
MAANVERRRLTKLSRSIEGKVAIVTGAASGMGRATAFLFADEGARVAVIDLGAERVRAVVDEITAAGGDARGWVCDVGDPAEVQRMVSEVAEHFGGIDILVNNAGIGVVAGADAVEADFEDAWAATLAVNLTSHARLIRAALPFLEGRGAGRVVNIASTEAIVTTAGMPAYAATKTGVLGLTRSFAVELGRRGVTVNAICPGPIRTGMTANIPEKDKEVYARRRVPLRRYGDPEEVAQATLSLVLPASSFINGATLVVDGGMSVRHT